MPKSSTPALLLTTVRFFVPLRRTAAMRFSGMPHKPKPPMRMVAPSVSFSMAASAEAMRLSMPCSEVTEAVYFIRHWSRKIRLDRSQRSSWESQEEAGVPHPRVFWSKSLELHENKRVEFLLGAKESARA